MGSQLVELVFTYFSTVELSVEQRNHTLNQTEATP